MKTVEVFAPAKINLSLRIGAVRADGYHPIESLVVFADIGDWIEAAPGPALTLDVAGEFAGDLAGEADNLVLRAARALAVEAGIEPNARLSLQKDLPVASGLGGGSSDAAATLKALNALWRLGYGEDRLAQIAATSRDAGRVTSASAAASSAVQRVRCATWWPVSWIIDVGRSR